MKRFPRRAPPPPRIIGTLTAAPNTGTEAEADRLRAALAGAPIAQPEHGDTDAALYWRARHGTIRERRAAARKLAGRYGRGWRWQFESRK